MLAPALVVLLAMLLCAAPVQAEGEPGPEGEPAGDPSAGDPGNETENGTDPTGSQPPASGAQAHSSQTGSQSGCEPVTWWGPSRPTYIVVDPQECYLPEPVRPLVTRITTLL